MPDRLSITAAEVRTIQRWLISISVRESTHISSGIDRLVSRWRVGVNDKITNDIGARYPFGVICGLASVRYDDGEVIIATSMTS